MYIYIQVIAYRLNNERWIVGWARFVFCVQQFPSLRRIAEACRPGEDVAARVVDAGCGTGALVDFLKEAGVEEGDVTGVDISPEVCTAMNLYILLLYNFYKLQAFYAQPVKNRSRGTVVGRHADPPCMRILTFSGVSLEVYALRQSWQCTFSEPEVTLFYP